VFELTIKCSKDIDELHINFSDGTSSVVSSKSEKTERSTRPKSVKKSDVALNLDEDYTVSEEVVEKPQIDIGERGVNVSKDMMNLEI